MPFRNKSHWQWRYEIAKVICHKLDFKKFGVKGFYLFGSTKNACAGPQSDIDIIIHFRGNEKQKECLDAWLEGWSLCLSQINYFLTNEETDELLDVHFVTDKDIKDRTSFAVKISAITDAARPLKVIDS